MSKQKTKKKQVEAHNIEPENLHAILEIMVKLHLTLPQIRLYTDLDFVNVFVRLSCFVDFSHLFTASLLKCTPMDFGRSERFYYCTHTHT